MASSLSNHIDNPAEVIHNIKCITCYTFCFKYTNANDELIEYKCFCCNKNYKIKFDENFKNKFASKYAFAIYDINKLFCCCEEMFIHLTPWINGKNSMRYNYQEKKIFIVT